VFLPLSRREFKFRLTYSMRRYQPFREAMAKKFPDQRVFFASWQRPRDIRDLSGILVSMLLFHVMKVSSHTLNLSFLFIAYSIPDIAKQHPHAMELNVLVIGMPNVGKSTLLNALRNMGIKGRASLFSPSPNRLDFPRFNTSL
jgi:hypothetical protein